MIGNKDIYYIGFCFFLCLFLAACLYQQWRGCEFWRVLSFLPLPVSWNLWFKLMFSLTLVVVLFWFSVIDDLKKMFLFPAGNKQHHTTWLSNEVKLRLFSSLHQLEDISNFDVFVWWRSWNETSGLHCYLSNVDEWMCFNFL